MILLPTRGRPKSVVRFVEAYRATQATLPVCIIVDEDDPGNFELPENWKVFESSKSRDLNSAFNTGFAAFPHAEFYGIMADDIVPQTPGWDIKLRDACLEHYIAWGDDGIRQVNALTAPALCTHPFIKGDLVRAWGWIMSPYTNRHAQDLIWRDFAQELGVGKFIPEVHTLHMHWQAGRGEFDTTYAIQPSAKQGDEQYRAYRTSEQFKEDVSRVREELGL